MFAKKEETFDSIEEKKEHYRKWDERRRKERILSEKIDCIELGTMWAIITVLSLKYGLGICSLLPAYFSFGFWEILFSGRIYGISLYEENMLGLTPEQIAEMRRYLKEMD